MVAKTFVQLFVTNWNAFPRLEPDFAKGDATGGLGEWWCMVVARMPVSQSHSRFRQLGACLLVILFSPLLLLLLLCMTLYGIALHLAIWLWWCTRGKYVLFVYSNSPHWQPYIESRVLPALENRAVVLNWSERATWPTWSLAQMAFRFFGGDRNCNPIAIVFRPFRFCRTFRFWGPFKEFKRGKPEAVETMVINLFAYLDGTAGKILT